MDDNIEEIKILFVGGSRAGKTSIISQFSNGVVEDDFSPTTGMSFMEKIVEFSNGSKVKIASCECPVNFELPITVQFGFSAIVLVYAVDEITEFYKDSVENWVRKIKQNFPNNKNIALLLNKIDQLEIKKDYYILNGIGYAKHYGVSFFSTCAKDNQLTNKFYEGLIKKIKNWDKEIKLIIKEEEQPIDDETDNEEHESKNEGKKKKCGCF